MRLAKEAFRVSSRRANARIGYDYVVDHVDGGKWYVSRTARFGVPTIRRADDQRLVSPHGNLGRAITRAANDNEQAWAQT